ncbi:GtrA family protein [Candidatus Kaiserbacteria bacterium]|nr:GtrA family protein [Candidatus Kaiserbacteria bacterium]
MSTEQFFQITRFLIAGTTATLVNLIALYVFTEFVGLWYIVSIACAFFIAFGVSFTLQKFWTFIDENKENIPKQAALFFAVQIANLIVNIYAVYVLVEIFHLWYMAAQFFTLLVIAVSNFFIFKLYIFKPKRHV